MHLRGAQGQRQGLWASAENADGADARSNHRGREGVKLNTLPEFSLLQARPLEPCFCPLRDGSNFSVKFGEGALYQIFRFSLFSTNSTPLLGRACRKKGEKGALYRNSRLRTRFCSPERHVSRGASLWASLRLFFFCRLDVKPAEKGQKF